MCGLGMTIKHRDTTSGLGHPQMQAAASREKALGAPCKCPVPLYRSRLGTEPTDLPHGPKSRHSCSGLLLALMSHSSSRRYRGQ